MCKRVAKIFQMGFISTIGHEVAKSVIQRLIVKIFVSPIEQNRLHRRRPLNRYTSPRQQTFDKFLISYKSYYVHSSNTNTDFLTVGNEKNFSWLKAY